MAVIIKETSIAATTTVENLFSGSAFEFARQDQLCSLGVTGSATGLQITFTSGADVVLEESPPIVSTVMPKIPDDFLVSDVARAGDRYVLRVRNTTGGALTCRAVLQLQDL